MKSTTHYNLLSLDTIATTWATPASLGLFFALIYSWNISQKNLEKIFKFYDFFYSTLIKVV
jgi:hypothetical protein